MPAEAHFGCRSPHYRNECPPRLGFTSPRSGPFDPLLVSCFCSLASLPAHRSDRLTSASFWAPLENPAKDSARSASCLFQLSAGVYEKQVFSPSIWSGICSLATTVWSQSCTPLGACLSRHRIGFKAAPGSTPRCCYYGKRCWNLSILQTSHWFAPWTRACRCSYACLPSFRAPALWWTSVGSGIALRSRLGSASPGTCFQNWTLRASKWWSLYLSKPVRCDGLRQRPDRP